MPEPNTAVSATALRDALDALDEAVFIIDSGRQILHANASCAVLFPHTGGFFGRRLITVALDSAVDELAARVLETGTPGEIRVTSGVHGDRSLQVNASPLAVTPDTRHALLVFRDETERVQTDQIRREFVANASHELRTPLAIICGYLENLLDGAMEDPETSQRFLRIIRKHTVRITRLVEDMLNISKLESGDPELLKSKSFNLEKCLMRVTSHLQSLIEEKQAEVVVNLAADATRIIGDRFYWEQVFFNLVENALKNNDPGSLHIHIESRRDETGGIHLSVRDNGIGIPQSSLPFIFKRFYRVEKAHSPDIPGTGLGLSIVKRAVEAHDGTIEVRSLPGQETAFLIHLPASRAAEKS